MSKTRVIVNSEEWDLTPHIPLSALPLSSRARNVLRYTGHTRVEQIAHLTEADLIRLRNVGRLTRSELLSLAEAARVALKRQHDVRVVPPLDREPAHVSIARREWMETNRHGWVTGSRAPIDAVRSWAKANQPLEFSDIDALLSELEHMREKDRPVHVVGQLLTMLRNVQDELVGLSAQQHVKWSVERGREQTEKYGMKVALLWMLSLFGITPEERELMPGEPWRPGGCA